MRVNFIKAALSGVQLQEAGMCLAVVVSKLSFVVRFAIYIGHSRVICRFVLHILQKKSVIYIYMPSCENMQCHRTAPYLVNSETTRRLQASSFDLQGKAEWKSIVSGNTH